MSARWRCRAVFEKNLTIHSGHYVQKGIFYSNKKIATTISIFHIACFDGKFCHLQESKILKKLCLLNVLFMSYSTLDKVSKLVPNLEYLFSFNFQLKNAATKFCFLGHLHAIKVP